MIDVNLPLELEDGTPVKFVSIDKKENRIQVNIPSMPYSPYKHIGRVFTLDGVHKFKDEPEGIQLKLRNKAMKLVDINKPVQVGGTEAKIIHVFDNGNLAVIVDGWAEVQNYNKYGQITEGGCVILRNTAEQQVTFHTLWAGTAGVVGSTYRSKDAAKKAVGKVDGFAGVLKITMVDGIATSAEIV